MITVETSLKNMAATREEVRDRNQLLIIASCSSALQNSDFLFNLHCNKLNQLPKANWALQEPDLPTSKH